MNVQLKGSVVGVKYSDVKAGRRYKIQVQEYDHPLITLSTLQPIDTSKIKPMVLAEISCTMKINSYTIEGKSYTVLDVENLKISYDQPKA
jgi:hypothetical protein